jgi:hypothetical protein
VAEVDEINIRSLELGDIGCLIETRHDSEASR